MFSACSNTSAKRAMASATTVFITIFASAMDCALPGIRNSNLLPVNANGEVRFLSVLSAFTRGMASTPMLMNCCSARL